MGQSQWTLVETYLTDRLVPGDAVLEATLAANRAAGLPQIDVSAAQGKFLQILARILSAKRILEIGTLGGYSTIWMARALPPDGVMVSLEMEPRHAEVARANLARARLSDRVEVVIGAALDVLPKIEADGQGPFDLIFIDADKPNNPNYFEWALRLSRPGTLIIVDNVVRAGAVADANCTDPTVQGVQRCVEMMAREPRVSTTALQTVGAKGWDGFAVALVQP